MTIRQEVGKKMSKVSVIVPVYNNENYIRACVLSLTGQTCSDLEIIVIDDGSRDRSREIVEELAGQDARIHLIHQENMGVAVARNRGIDEASGEYLTFVDGDDYVSPDYIEHFLNCACEHDADMVICGISFVEESGKVLRRLTPDEYRRFEREEWTFRISAVCSHFYKRSLWEKHQIRFYPGERGEDLPIALFFSAICERIAVLPENGYFYVQHGSSARHNFRGLKNYRLPYGALEEILKKVEEVGVANSREFYEVFVLRILATCFFDLGRGASRDKMKELCDYIVRILQTYFPGYYQNRLTRLFSGLRVPFPQKAAVWLLVFLTRTKLIYPASRMISH